MLKTYYRTAAAYQHYPYTSHYPQAAYAGHYPYTAPQSASATTTTTQTQQQASSSSSSSQQQQQTRQPAQYSSNMDTADIATLNDALGSAGVDLRVSSSLPPLFYYS